MELDLVDTDGFEISCNSATVAAEATVIVVYDDHYLYNVIATFLPYFYLAVARTVPVQYM